jgi:hypothetical protein
MFALFHSVSGTFALVGSGEIGFSDFEHPDGTILSADNIDAITLLSIIQAVLLKVVLPIIVVG